MYRWPRRSAPSHLRNCLVSVLAVSLDVTWLARLAACAVGDVFALRPGDLHNLAAECIAHHSLALHTLAAHAQVFLDDRTLLYDELLLQHR
jgi:hypothetical protein